MKGGMNGIMKLKRKLSKVDREKVSSEDWNVNKKVLRPEFVSKCQWPL